MRGRLNSFQKTMLQWNHLHAYNAVHVVRVADELDRSRLTGVINDLLAQHGLTHLTLDLQRKTFGYGGGAGELAVQIVAGSGHSQEDLMAEMERQLNTGFDLSGSFNPFRFFAVPEAGNFLLGLVYFHAVADAEAVVLLLKELVTAYVGRGRRGGAGSLELYPRRYDNLLRLQPRVIGRRLLGLPAQARMMRSTMRVPASDPGNLQNGLRLFTLGRDALHRLVVTAKTWEVTVNDVLLALLLKALAPLAGNRAAAGRRKNLSLGCIVNLRKDLGVDSLRTFGLFLGSFMVTHVVPERISLQQLACDLRDQTLAIKRHRLYLATPWELGIARLMLSFFSPEQRKKFYQKNYPLWGGITNMNLNSLWPAAEAAPAPDYFRAVSTGPVTPLVLSVTTVGDHANIGLTYRTTVYSELAVEQIKISLLQTLAGLHRNP
jgi:NRPS condensation-like uncharacterized protein